MSDSSNARLLTTAWKARNGLYAELFGDYKYVLPKHYAPPDTDMPGFRKALKAEEEREGPPPKKLDLDRFHTPLLKAGERMTVLAYSPNEQRDYWLYVTAGLSNPWFQDEPDEVSGFGCELMLKCDKDSRWAIRILRRLSYYILSYTGTLSPGVILDLEGASQKVKESGLSSMLIWYADEAPDCWYQLPSGGFGLFCAVGITEDECKFGESVEAYGTWCIQQVLRQTGVGQITKPGRNSVMQTEGINSILSSVRTYADNFRDQV